MDDIGSSEQQNVMFVSLAHRSVDGVTVWGAT